MGWQVYSATGSLKTVIADITSANLTAALTTPPPIGGTTPGTGAFTNLSATGLLDVNGGSFRPPVTASALTTTEGYFKWDSTRKELMIYDSQAERGIGTVGWCPVAFPVGFVHNNAFATQFNMATQWDTTLIPMFVPSKMKLHSVKIRQTSTGTARTWGWDLYVNRLNNGNSGENTIVQLAKSSADQSFTPSAASDQEITAASAVDLSPGVYWLAIQNRHASNALALAAYTVNTFGWDAVKRKSGGTGGTNNTQVNLDAVTSWTTTTSMAAALMVGRVLGEATGF